jgi:hypothetical protein
LLVLVCLAGCASARDENATEAELIAPGEPSITLGYYTRDGYQPLSTAAEAPVLWGTQGGTWTMPSVRTRGIASPALVWGNVTLASEGGPAEVLGSVEREHAFTRAQDGSLESRALAVPIQHAPPRQFDSISDLYGQPALLSVMATDEQGRSAAVSVAVTLIED